LIINKFYLMCIFELKLYVFIIFEYIGNLFRPS